MATFITDKETSVTRVFYSVKTVCKVKSKFRSTVHLLHTRTKCQSFFRELFTLPTKATVGADQSFLMQNIPLTRTANFLVFLEQMTKNMMRLS